MLTRTILLSAPALAFALVGAMAPPPAHAVTAKECSALYKAAKADGSIGAKSWNDFRKEKCGPSNAAPAAATAAPAAQAPAAAPAAEAKAPAPAAAAAAGQAVFPTAVSPKYANETPGKARMHTCLDQYRANKATNGNGGMTWISRKGGGYYSACNKKLKG